MTTDAVDVVEEIVTTLAARRKVLGITQSAVARAMGTSQSAVSEIEKLQAIPRIGTLRRYAAACGGATVRVELDLPDIFEAASEFGPAPKHHGQAYVAINDHGGIGWAGIDRERVSEYARNTGSVVVALPVVADFRHAAIPS